MIRIAIADDHAIVRGGLKQILAMTPDIAVTAEATNVSDVIDVMRHGELDLLLLDMAMPGISGVELIVLLQRERPSLPLLILSMHNEGQIVARALKAGASGYVTKDSDPEILLAAIRKVAGGGRFIDPALVDVMVFEASGRDLAPHELLTEREFQVLDMIAAGQTIGAIADCLHLSPKTVSTHKMRLMHKLEIDSNVDLVRYAIKHGLPRQ
ncbi:MAG TPA: response regulator transcription factor [Rhodocyclaceae bacterium]|nr:response regulator transcription factor [Rhodocyclaceae bacterium]